MREHESAEKFLQAFEAMGEAELAGLRAFAERLASGSSGYTCGRDLLHEAIYRVVDGRRRWPRDVPLQAFLANAMRSIVNVTRRRADFSSRASGWDVEVRESSTFETWAEPPPGPEELLARRQRMEFAARGFDEAREELAGDEEGLGVLDGMRSDMSAPEMRESLGLALAQFRAARERAMSRLRAWGRRQP